MLLGLKARIAYLNLTSKARIQRPHVSGYVCGDSPATDLLAVVDNAGQVAGCVNRRDAHANGIRHATVHLLLFNSRGNLLVQMRSPKKDGSPGKLSQSVGGHVPFGLAPTKVLEKEAFEELGVRTECLKLVITHPTYLYSSNGGKNQELVSLFTGNYDGPVYPNYTEVAWAAFFGLAGLNALYKSEPAKFAPSFIEDLRHMELLTA
ncbi:MAG: NUDIX domain-containing protein [Patescibacteria group bacterium]